MSATLTALAKPEVIYPIDDGKPLSEHMTQLRWIVTIKEGLGLQYASTLDVMVAGDLLWYPVEGNNRICAAPDIMTAFGVDKHERGSYKQWEEGGIAPQVVFEILSPGNRAGEMVEKYIFYTRYGVEEYYLYDPFSFELRGWYGRSGADGLLEPIPDMNGWASPRLGIRFELPADGSELVLYHPDGSRFLSFPELQEAKANAERRADAAEVEAERLRARLRELGIDPDTV